MTFVEVSLLSSCIGAATSILIQFIANGLKNRADKKKIIFNLISEERKLAHMIVLNQRSYCLTGHTIEYYYQLAVVSETSKQQEKDIERHHAEIGLSNILHAEYCALIGDYCKNIYALIQHLGHADELEEVLSKILNYRHEDVTGMFDGHNKYPELWEAYTKKQNSIPETLKIYKSYFDEARQLIERIKVKKSWITPSLKSASPAAALPTPS